MKIRQKRVLRSVFSLKGNLRAGVMPVKKVFDGVEIAPYKNHCKAAVSISADFELNWAFRCLAPGERDRLGTTERRNVPYILELLDQFKVPITWATVGHLFLNSCKSEGGCAHKNMPRPPANPRWQGDWYKHDPCSDFVRDPLWYAPDLVDKILTSKTTHEVGSHSFSHIDFSSRTSDDELVRGELEESLAAVARFGLRLKSLVYPYNHLGHSYHELLHEFGIIAVRHRDDKVRLSYPERMSSGVYKIYESMNLRSPHLYEYRDKAEILIQRATQLNAAYHLWFHPSDPHASFRKEFYEILEVIQRHREAGDVWVTTMGELAAYCEARESMIVRMTGDRERKSLDIRSSLDCKRYGTPEITLLVPSEGVPTRIERHIGDRAESLSPNSVCARNDKAIALNVPAVDQIIKLWY